MNNFYIYLGMAVAAILVLFLVFKPEFSVNRRYQSLHPQPWGPGFEVEEILKKNYRAIVKDKFVDEGRRLHPSPFVAEAQDRDRIKVAAVANMEAPRHVVGEWSWWDEPSHWHA